jgi:hypothetical protein
MILLVNLLVFSCDILIEQTPSISQMISLTNVLIFLYDFLPLPTTDSLHWSHKCTMC